MDWFASLAAEAAMDGKWKVIPFRSLRKASEREGLSPAQGEILCLERGFVPSRYVRSMGTLGLDGQISLLRSAAAVIGCGGLGGLVSDLLARAGVGRLVLADSDVFDDSNLNRQILASEINLGTAKAKAAAMHATEVNGAVSAEGRQCRFDSYTAGGILAGCTVAVDCLDNLPARRLLFGECSERGIPVVTGAIGGFWGQVTVVLPGDGSLPGFLAGNAERGIEIETGNPPFTPAAVAALECAQVLKLLTGKGNILAEELLWMDLEEDEFRRLSLRREG